MSWRKMLREMPLHTEAFQLKRKQNCLSLVGDKMGVDQSQALLIISTTLKLTVLQTIRSLDGTRTAISNFQFFVQ